MAEQPKVTGIGGIFFKSKDHKKLLAWYSENLGFKINDYGASFAVKKNTGHSVFLQFSIFEEKTDYLDPSKAPFMINFRVNDLVGLKKNLEARQVEIVDEMATYEYGKFLHIMDPEGNKIELWEPVDGFFDENNDGDINYS